MLLGTALILGAAQTTAKAEETTTENKTEAVASAPKDDKVRENVRKCDDTSSFCTTEAAVLVEKPTLSDEEVAKLAAEVSKKDDKTSETATTEKQKQLTKKSNTDCSFN